MKISLIRHGRPAIDFASPITSAAFPVWLRAYESAGIDPALPPPTTLLGALRDCRLLFTSPAPRATTSVALLALPIPHQLSPLAAEAPLSPGLWFPVKMRPGSWLVLARTLWLLRCVQAVETVPAVRRRATTLAAELARAASSHGHVALVTHGYLIRFLHPALRVAGWRRLSSPMLGYWSHALFEQ